MASAIELADTIPTGFAFLDEEIIEQLEQIEQEEATYLEEERDRFLTELERAGYSPTD